jgi:hypothetical protein
MMIQWQLPVCELLSVQLCRAFFSVRRRGPSLNASGPLSALQLSTENRQLFTSLRHFHRIDDADYRRIDRTVLASESHSSRAALYDQDDFVHARADGVDRHDVSGFILAVDADEPGDQELAPKKAVIFSRSDDGSNYSSKKHVLDPINVTMREA